MKTNFVFTGGRLYQDKERVHEICEIIKNINTGGFGTVHVGCAGGLDALVRAEFAGYHEGFFKVHKANWENGRVAGPVRNGVMLRAAGPKAVVFAFPGGAGTLNCIEQAKKLGYTVLRIDHEQRAPRS